MKVACALMACALLAACESSREGGRGAPATRAAGSPIALVNGEPMLSVTLDRNGVTQIGATRILFDDDIVNAFRTFHERAPRGKLALSAHRSTLHGRLVRIVDLAKEANVPFELVVED